MSDIQPATKRTMVDPFFAPGSKSMTLSCTPSDTSMKYSFTFVFGDVYSA